MTTQNEINTYFNTAPLQSIHYAKYSNGNSFIRRINKKTPYPGNTYYIDGFNLNCTASKHYSFITCSAIEVIHLGDTLEEAIRLHPEYFI